MAEEKKLNGVDVAYVEDTIKAIEQTPELASFKFRVKNRWLDCGHSRAMIEGFYGANQEHVRNEPFVLDADEPPVLAGKDLGPNPVEFLLRGLAGCMTNTMVYHAALRGIRIEELEAELEGDIDLRGFLGLSEDVRQGYENIRITFKVKTDAENLDRLKALSKFSPVYDTVTRGTKVETVIQAK
ncbi:MAG: OsmC family protein [Desulfuromonadales bacterium]